MNYTLTKENINNLKNKKLFLFDMDGTIYNDDKLFWCQRIDGKY